MNRATLRQLFWICIVSIVAVTARRSVTEEEKNSPFVNSNYLLCDRKECFAVEDVLVNTYNKYGNECEDYYHYVCHKNYTGSNDHDPFSRKPNQVFQDFTDILERMPTRGEQGNHALRIERQIYKLCQGQDVFSHDEKRYYEGTTLHDRGANRLLSSFQYTRGQVNDWTEKDLKYALDGFGFAFFDVAVYEKKKLHPDNYSDNKRYILIKPPTEGVQKKITPLLQHFEKNFETGLSRSKYQNLKNFMDQLTSIVAQGQIELQDNPRILSISSWQNEHDLYSLHAKNAEIDWFNYLSKLLFLVNAPMYKGTEIAIQGSNYFHSLATLHKTTDIDAIVDYVHLHFVSKTIGLTDTKYREDSIFPQLDGLICTPGLLVGTAHAYAKMYFPNDNRVLLESMVSNVRDAVLERVQRAIPQDQNLADFMNLFIRDYEKTKIFAAYPEWLANETIAFTAYGGDRRSSWGNRFYDQQVDLIKKLQQVKLLPYVNTDLPIYDPAELLHAFKHKEIKVSPQEIYIPFGYFSEKDYRFFSAQIFDPINYGAAATEVAFKLYYELLTYIQYSQKVVRCVRDQVPEHIRDRDDYVMKAAAYLLAVDTAYNLWPSKHSYPIQFVDFGAVTDTSLFFLSFAESLCTIPPIDDVEQTPAAYRELKEPTASYRTNDFNKLPHYIHFALQNSQAFAETYNCQRNQTMFREEKCDPLRFY